MIKKHWNAEQPPADWEPWGYGQDKIESVEEAFVD